MQGAVKLGVTAVAMLCLASWPMCAQTPAAAAPATPPATEGRAMTQAPPTTITQPVLPGMATAPGAELDRVVAIVNGDLILDSDVDQELRLDELEPYGEATTGNSAVRLRSQAIERLINRDLILQQVTLQPVTPITDAAVDQELDGLRRNIPACKEYHCETQAGWAKLLAANGFTEAGLRQLWRQRMVVLAFIEQRFRMGIRIAPAEIQAYYTETLLPQYAARHAAPPPVEAIANRIQEVLLAQRVSSLLNDWLQSLRAQGSIVLLHPGEAAP
jgi:hypothetical protein